MPPIRKEDRLSAVFPFLDKRKKSDVKIWETYVRFKKFNGNKSNPNTLRDMIRTIGNLLNLYEDRLLISVKHGDDGYNVEVIDTTIIKDKGD